LEYKSGEIFVAIEELVKEDMLKDGVPYNDTLSLSNVNKKIKGTNIAGIDTFRGCRHDCLDCYARKMSKIARKDFGHAVPVIKFTGKIIPEKTYRFGTVGDPDHDWAHTSFIVRTMKDLGLKNYFFITKLQSIVGIESGDIRNVQVSLDPLNKKHFFKTLKNIRDITGKIDNIVIRLRTVRTHNRDINRLQNIGVAFTEKHKLPILETKMKFSKKRYIDDLELHGYERINNGFQIKGSILRDFKKDIMSCDEFNTGSCTGCDICPVHGRK